MIVDLKIKVWKRLRDIRPVDLQKTIAGAQADSIPVPVIEETDIQKLINQQRRRWSEHKITQSVATNRRNIKEICNDRRQFVNQYSQWGKKRCNCQHPNCKLFSACILCVCGNVFGTLLRRSVKCDSVDNVKDTRLSFIHFLRWDERHKHPIETTIPQSWGIISELVSKVLSLRQHTLPEYIVSFCKHRGTVTDRQLQDEILNMGNETVKQQTEVCF